MGKDLNFVVFLPLPPHSFYTHTLTPSMSLHRLLTPFIRSLLLPPIFILIHVHILLPLLLPFGTTAQAFFSIATTAAGATTSR